jgi:HAD superfamily hydrolase (TIGR01490 family)
MRAAIFDVDRTLLDGMSGYLFSRHLIEQRAMPLGRVIHSLRALVAYRLGWADAMAIVEAGATCLAGLTTERAVELADRTVDRVLRPRFFTEGLAAVDAHRAAGDAVVLASGSNTFLIQAIARAIGASDAIGSGSRVEGGRLLPEMTQPACAFEGKRDLVLAWLAARDFDPADAVCYTDNGIDIPLIEAVGEAVAVNPDRELAAYAARRGLAVRRWETPVDPGRSRSGSSFPIKD